MYTNTRLIEELQFIKDNKPYTADRHHRRQFSLFVINASPHVYTVFHVTEPSTLVHGKSNAL